MLLAEYPAIPPWPTIWAVFRLKSMLLAEYPAIVHVAPSRDGQPPQINAFSRVSSDGHDEGDGAEVSRLKSMLLAEYPATASLAPLLRF